MVARTCGKNSFAPNTPVRTLSGLVAISALTIGTPVLAYNEQTGENGYYPITAVHKNVDPDITYLVVKDPEQGGKLEYIETTPEHPFYVKEGSENESRPKPVGHENLGKNWVGAGHLKMGDKIKQADGTTGVVANVLTLQQTREMYNLTISEAHTYYVGQDSWLVHNTSCSLEARAKQIQALQPPGKAQNMSTTAVTEAIDGSGNMRYIVSGSRNRLTPAQRKALGPNEIEGVGPGHAEVTGINNAVDWGWLPTRQAASRPICPACEAYQKGYGVTPTSPLRGGK